MAATWKAADTLPRPRQRQVQRHSDRVGMYTVASEAGIAIEAVAALARHKSVSVTQKYVRKADWKTPALALWVRATW